MHYSKKAAFCQVRQKQMPSFPAKPGHGLAGFFIKPGLALKAKKARNPVSFIAPSNDIEAAFDPFTPCTAFWTKAVHHFLGVFGLSAHIL